MAKRDHTGVILAILGIIAGIGIGAAVLSSRSSVSTSGFASQQRGTLRLIDSQQQSYGNNYIGAGGIENYSEITWTDAMGNERKMTSRRIIHEQ